MRWVLTVAAALLAAGTCGAQQWSVSAEGGFGVYRNAAIVNPSGTADAGFDNRFALSGAIGEDRYEHIGGELRYTFRDSDLKLSQSGAKVNMDGDASAVHFDLLLHATGRRARIRPFAAVGGGIVLFRATGKEYVSQPFSDFAHLTRTNEVKPLLSVGGGVQYALTARIRVRLDFRDYITPFPEELFAAAPGARIHGWLHDFVPLAGISFAF